MIGMTTRHAHLNKEQKDLIQQFMSIVDRLPLLLNLKEDSETEKEEKSSYLFSPFRLFGGDQIQYGRWTLSTILQSTRRRFAKDTFLRGIIHLGIVIDLSFVAPRWTATRCSRSRGCLHSRLVVLIHDWIETEKKWHIDE